MPETLETIVRRLAARQAGVAEATIQADVAALLRLADLDLETDDLRLEAPAPDRMRIDIEVGRTVIEVKRNLDKVRAISKSTPRPVHSHRPELRRSET